MSVGESTRAKPRLVTPQFALLGFAGLLYFFADGVLVPSPPVDPMHLPLRQFFGLAGIFMLARPRRCRRGSPPVRA